MAALDLLVAGDVVLIEQQTSAFDAYCPMEYIPVFWTPYSGW